MPADATTRPTIRTLPSPEDVAAAAAEEIVRGLATAIDERGIAHWATTGGSAAPGIYRVLRVPPLRDAVDWGRVHVWWGDDRFVPADHPLSNVLPLTQLLLDGGDEAGSGATGVDVAAAGAGVHLPAANLHPVPVSAAIGRGGGPAWAAAAYAEALVSMVPAADGSAGGVPAFDVIVLGVGPDGHVLSVFPGSAVWDDPSTCAAVPAPTHVEPHVARVTIHPRLLGAAGRVLVVSTGASKADVLGRAWAGGDVRELPVRATFLPNATWLLDEAAAANLPGGDGARR
ncbi:MAG: 6-phosphogluconolactonase [Chloroflexota bacterium]